MMQPDTDSLVRNFHDNLNFFEEKYPALFQKLTALETALVNGYYTPVYELVYENGYFDVIRLATGEPYYGANSVKLAEEAASHVTYKKNEGVFETFSRPQCVSDEISDILEKHTNAVCSFARYSADATDTLEAMNKIHKFIFIGVGLGFHVQKIDQKIKAGAYLIIEDDLELFRLSLFTMRYAELAEKSDLAFSVFENDVEFDKTITMFLSKGFFFNHRIKFHFMKQHPIDKIKLIQHAVLTQKHLQFAFSNMLWTALRPLDYIQGGYSFLNIGPHLLETSVFKKPVLMIGAGPSLSANREWVKRHYSRFTVVAVSSALPALYAWGITPDIVTHVDGFEAGVGHLRGYEDGYLANTLLIARANCHPGVMAYFKKENVFIFEMGTSYYHGNGSLWAPCVGSNTYLLLLNLGIKTLYLLGLDLALDQASGSTHVDTHMANESIDLSGAERIDHEASGHTTLIPVKGNLHEKVLTVPRFKQSLDDLYLAVPQCLRQEQKVFNLGNGAYIPGSMPQEIPELQLDVSAAASDPKVSIESLAAFLQLNSRTVLTESELASFKKRLLYVREVKQAIHAHAQEHYGSFEEYQQALFELITRVIRTGGESSDLSHILLTYFRQVLSYVFDLFNTKGITEAESHLAYIQQLLVDHMSQISGAYEKRIEIFLNTYRKANQE